MDVGSLTLPEIVQRFSADTSGLAKAGDAFKSWSSTMSAGLGGFAKDMTTKFTLPVLGVVAVAVNGAKKIDDAYRTISRGTGQLGKPLDDLKKAFDDTFKKVPEDAQTVAGAIVQIHDKLGLVGTQLSTVTGQMLEFATATGNALDPSTVANYFQRWKIGAKEMAPMLDALARLSQATGVSGQSIIQQATTNAPALQQGGFSANQGAALIAYLQQSGGKSQAVLSGFQRIETNAQKFGLDPKKVVADLMQALKDGTGNLASDMAQMSKSGSLATVGGNAPGSAGALAQDKIAGLIAQENALLAKGTAVAPLDVARISQEEVIKQKIRDKAASQNRPLTAAETVQINQADTIITKLDAAATPKGLNAAQQAQLATIKDTIAKDSGGPAASTTNQQAIAALLGPRGALEAQTTLGATGQQKYQALITTETKGPTIEQMAASTRSFSEQMKILGHNVDEALKPLGMWLITAGTDIAGYLIPIVQTLSGWFSGLPSIIKTGFAGLMIGGAVIGPVLLGIGKVMSVFDNMGKTVGKISDVVAGLIPGGAQAVGAGAGAGAQAAASGMTATDKGLAVAGGVQGVSSAETIVKDTPGARDAKRLLTGKPTGGLGASAGKVGSGVGAAGGAVAGGQAIAGAVGGGAEVAGAVAGTGAAVTAATTGGLAGGGLLAGADVGAAFAATEGGLTASGIGIPVAIVIGAVAAIGAAIYEVVNHWRGMRTAAVEAWAWIKQAASDAWKFLQPILSSIGSFIVNVVLGAFKMLVRDVPPIFAAIEGAVVSAWNTISPILMTLGGALVTGVSAAWRGVSSAVSAVVSAVTTGWRDVKSASEDTWKVVSAVVRDAWAVVEPVLRFMAMIVRDVVLAAWFILRQEVAGVWFIVSHVIGAAWAVISPILSTLANVVGTVVVGAFHVLASAVGGIWGGISAGAGAAWSVLSPVFSAIAGAVGVALPAAFGFLERLGAGIWSGLTSIATTVWPVLRPILAAIGDAVSVGIVPTLQNLQSIAASVFSAIGSALATAWGVIWPILKLIGEIVLIAVIGPFVLLERAVTGTVRVIAGILQYLWTGIIGPIFRFIVAVIKDTLIVQFYILRDAVAGVFAVVGWLIGAAWRDVIKPVFGFIVDAIKVGVIQQFHLLQDVVSAVFAAVGWVIAAAWNDVIKPVFGFIVNVLTTVLTSAFRGFQLVVGTVWAGIQTVIGVAWDIIKAIFGAVVDALTLVLAPAFSAAQVLIGLAWAGIQTLVQTGWDIIKTVFGAIETYLVGPAVDMWNTFAGALSAVWSALPDALSSVWDTIQGIFFAGVNAVISVLNGFITVLDLIPGVSIKPIGLVHQTAVARPAANTGAVGSKGGFFAGGITSGPALVGEGGPAPEYVIPTDPKYRSRALGLWAGVGAKIGAPGMKGGGIIGDVTGAVGAAAGAVAGAVSSGVENVAQALAKPGELAALTAANTLPAMWVGMAKNVITSIYNALTGAGSGGGGGPGAVALPGGGSRLQNAQLGQKMAAAVGWTGAQWDALNKVIMRESGWYNLAQNPTSPAFGIGQALPPTKYPFAGQLAGGANPGVQIAWTLDYIKSRYGTPAGAEAHEIAYNWYDKGGVLPPGLTMAMNTTGHNEYVTSGLAAAHELGPAARHFIEAMAAGIAAAQERNAPSPAQANREYHITVHNPVAETAEESIGHQMSRLAYLGVAG